MLEIKYWLIVLVAYIFGNIIWHKKIIDGKWIYTIYTTIILIGYSIIFALINF